MVPPGWNHPEGRFQSDESRRGDPATLRPSVTAAYHRTMSEADATRIRTSLIDGIRASRAAEREVFGAVDPAEREVPGPDGGWSAKDTLAHLSAWRQREVDRLSARRKGREDPTPPAAAPGPGIDEINLALHAERADWTWDRVVADADATTDALIAEVSAANEAALIDPKVIGSILGDGAEHTLGHLPPFAAGVGQQSRVLALADEHLAAIDRGGWPSTPDAVARYNLACFHALAGNLDVARSLLRQALPGQEHLQTLAPTDDDLIAVRYELPVLAEG
jgi:hypothetical protein